MMERSNLTFWNFFPTEQLWHRYPATNAKTRDVAWAYLHRSFIYSFTTVLKEINFHGLNINTM